MKYEVGDMEPAVVDTPPARADDPFILLTSDFSLPPAPSARLFCGDGAAWDRLLLGLGGHVLQSYRWGEFKRRHGWDVERLTIHRGPAGGRVVGAAQIFFKRRYGLSVGYVPRGPVLDFADERALTAGLAALDRLCRERRAIALLIEPDDPAGRALACHGFAPTWRSLHFQPRRTIKVAVDRGDDALLAAMKPKTRYNVRLAMKRGVTVRCGAGEADLDAFYRLAAETARRDGFGIHTRAYYADLLGVFGDRAALFLAECGGEPAAAVIALRAGQEAIYHSGASSERHRQAMPSYLAQFAALRWARDRGCAWYDLWGIPEDDEPPAQAGRAGTANVRAGLWGVYRFKQGFGGEVVAYPGTYERAYVRPLVWLWHHAADLG